MSEAWNLKQKKHLNFRDQLEIIEPNQEMKQLLTHSSAIVDIDHIFTSAARLPQNSNLGHRRGPRYGCAPQPVPAQPAQPRHLG